MNTELIKSYARKYYAMGWPMVPLFEYSKNPATGNPYMPFYWQDPKTKANSLEEKAGWFKKQGWWPLSQRKQTAEEIKTWIDNPNITGIGIVTGRISNILVIDEDSYKEGGKTFNVESPLVAESANGGLHHYFKFNENVGTTGLQQGVFVEIKSAGGFVVAVPSEVRKKDKTIGQYVWRKENLKNINDLPTITEADLMDLSVKKEAQKIILSDLTEVGFGEQHNSLRTLANSLLAKNDPKDWEQFVFPIIREKAAAYDPPHPEYRVEKMIQDCSDFILRKKNEKNLPQSIHKIVQKRLVEKEMEKDAPSTGYPDLDRILIGFIPGHVYCLSGLTNVGKSSTAANFSTRVAAQNKRVLYFSLEPDNNIVDYLASAQTGKRFKDLTPEDLGNINPNIEIYTKDQISTLPDMINALKKLPRYDFIVIDHLGYFIQGEAKSGTFQEQENALKKLVALAQQQRSAVMFIVHMRKKTGYTKKLKDGEKFIPDINELKGSSALSQDSTDVIFVTRENSSDGITQSNEGRMVVVKTKSGKNGAMEIYFVDDSAKIVGPEEMATRMF